MGIGDCSPGPKAGTGTGSPEAKGRTDRDWGLESWAEWLKEASIRQIFQPVLPKSDYFWLISHFTMHCSFIRVQIVQYLLYRPHFASKSTFLCIVSGTGVDWRLKSPELSGTEDCSLGEGGRTGMDWGLQSSLAW